MEYLKKKLGRHNAVEDTKTIIQLSLKDICFTKSSI